MSHFSSNEPPGIESCCRVARAAARADRDLAHERSAVEIRKTSDELARVRRALRRLVAALPPHERELVDEWSRSEDERTRRELLDAAAHAARDLRRARTPSFRSGVDARATTPEHYRKGRS